MVKSRSKKIQETKKQRNIIPTILATLLLISLLLFVIYFVDPETFPSIPIFFALIFFSLFSALSIFTKKLIPKLTIGATVTIFLILRYFQMGNFVNLFLLIGLALTILAYESYFKKSD